jgi:hypothetical protein
MNHARAWQRLPDLLDDRDDTALLAHVSECPACQRQLFLLGRIDRILRHESPELPHRWRQRRGMRILATTGAIAAVASVAVLIVLVLARPPHAVAFTLRTPTGRVVGEATISKNDAHNASLTLAARDLPAERGRVFVLWASDGTASMPVGRFMVDPTGDCRVRFNLPESRAWHQFWISRAAGPTIARGLD